MRIILASASPRRKELLKKLFPDFEIIPAKGEERCFGKTPKETVMELSAVKAEEIGQSLQSQEDYLIIGADTLVALQNEVLGKPENARDAEKTLKRLSGNTHQVYTGVTLLLRINGARKCITFAECTLVRFYPVSAAEITAYVNSKEPMDKAGSYGIQGLGGRFVEGIEGDYDNVVGLPVAKIYQVLKKIEEFALPF